MAFRSDSAEEQTRKKWLWGCCGGCGGLVLLSVIAVAVGLYFLLRSRPLVPPETFLSPSADAFMIIQVSPDDEDLVRMLQEFVKNPPAELELTEKQKKRLMGRADRVADDLAQVLPLNLVVTARHIEPRAQAAARKFAFGAILSIKGFSGLGRFVLKLIIGSLPQEGGRVEHYKEVDIGISQGGACLAALNNNFMFAGDTETIETWIDRIGEQELLMKQAEEGKKTVLPYEGPEALKRMFERLDRSSRLLFASLNSHGEVKAFLEALQRAELVGEGGDAGKEVAMLVETGITSPRVHAVGGTGHIVGPDTMELQLLVECDDEEFAAALLDQLLAVLGNLAPELGIEALEGTLDGSLVRLKFSKPGLQEALHKAAGLSAEHLAR